jgi:hypothetical protein
VTSLLMYKNKINIMEDKRLPKVASNSSKNHLCLKWVSHKDAKYWLSHSSIEEEVTLQNNYNIKNIITTKFKEKIWCNKELEDKRILRYYKEVINPNP